MMFLDFWTPCRRRQAVRKNLMVAWCPWILNFRNTVWFLFHSKYLLPYLSARIFFFNEGPTSCMSLSSRKTRICRFPTSEKPLNFSAASVSFFFFFFLKGRHLLYISRVARKTVWKPVGKSSPHQTLQTARVLALETRSFALRRPHVGLVRPGPAGHW